MASKNTKKTVPYSDNSFGTEPTGYVKFWRTCIIKQYFRFFLLNLKIMKIVIKGHS